MFEILVGGATIVVVPFVILSCWYARQDYRLKKAATDPPAAEAPMPSSQWRVRENLRLPLLLGLGAAVLISNWLLLAAAFGWMGQFKNESPTAITLVSPPLPPPQSPGKREIIDTTPEYLMGLYQDKTTLQGNELFRTFPGKWMHLTQTIADIADLQVWSYLEKSNGKRPIVMFFDDQSKVDPLRTKQKISALCQIVAAKVNLLVVAHCELESK